jgi:SAM-dependent methyltransferase
MLLPRIKWKLKRVKAFLSDFGLQRNKGYCVCCEREVMFVVRGDYLRNDYRCSNCNSIPRNRALIKAIQLFAPNYKDLYIHESSPGNASSKHLKRNCPHYSDSQFFSDIERGSIYGKFRCEDLENMTFAANSFDLFITADVFEHVMRPEAAFREIARVLKPGGMHIFTIPWYPKLKESRRRARTTESGEIEFLEAPVYHGNPVSKDGSLVTMDWGIDFCDKIFEYSGMTTTVFRERDRYYGLDGDFLEVFVSRKRG